MKMFRKLFFLSLVLSVFTSSLSCSIMLPLSATGEVPSSSDKVGTAKVVMPLGFVFGGDASIEKAAENGGITKIKTVNVLQKNILGLVFIVETKVTGE